MINKKNTILICIFGSILFILPIIILSTVPPVSRDALTHHLAVPKLYINNGAVYEIPDKIVSYYPMNLDLLYTIPLYFGNDIIPKYIHFFFAILTAIFIYLYLKEHIGSSWGWLGAFFFISLPIIVKLSITVYVDLGLIFFSTTSIFYMLKWKNEGFEPKHIVISAIFCGLALGTKYNGLICLLLLSLFIAFIYVRLSNGSVLDQLNGIKYGVLFVCIALIVFSPWMIKNYAWTGNPLYPLFDSLFNFGKGVDLRTSSEMGHFIIRKLIYNESFLEILLIPFRIFFQGVDNDPIFFDGKLNPFLFILPLFIFCKKKSKIQNIIDKISDKKILFIFSCLFIIIVFLKQDMRIRYIGPAIPPLVILSIYGLKNLYSYFEKDNIGKLILVFVCLIVFILNFVYIVNQFKYVKPFLYLSGKISKTEYIKQYRPEYSVIQYANQTLPRESIILSLFLGDRSYYSDNRMIFDQNVFKKTVKQSSECIDIIENLKKNDFTHIILNFEIFNSWVKSQFSRTEKKRVNEFLKSIELIFSKDGYCFYKL